MRFTIDMTITEAKAYHMAAQLRAAGVQDVVVIDTDNNRVDGQKIYILQVGQQIKASK